MKNPVTVSYLGKWVLNTYLHVQAQESSLMLTFKRAGIRYLGDQEKPGEKAVGVTSQLLDQNCVFLNLAWPQVASITIFPQTSSSCVFDANCTVSLLIFKHLLLAAVCFACSMCQCFQVAGQEQFWGANSLIHSNETRSCPEKQYCWAHCFA